MVAVPTPTAVTKPLVAFTVATAVLLDVHAIARPVRTLFAASRVVAVACVVCPTAMLLLLSATETLATAAAVPVTVKGKLKAGAVTPPPAVKLIVAVPGPTAVMSARRPPAGPTTASTAGSLDVTVAGTSSAFGENALSNATAQMLIPPPTTRGFGVVVEHDPEHKAPQLLTTPPVVVTVNVAEALTDGVLTERTVIVTCPALSGRKFVTPAVWGRSATSQKKPPAPATGSNPNAAIEQAVPPVTSL